MSELSNLTRTASGLGGTAWNSAQREAEALRRHFEERLRYFQSVANLTDEQTSELKRNVLAMSQIGIEGPLDVLEREGRKVMRRPR